MIQDQFEALMEKAREFNRDMDTDDASQGFLRLCDMSPPEQLEETIISIEDGILLEDWALVAQGLDLLHRVQATVRAADDRLKMRQAVTNN